MAKTKTDKIVDALKESFEAKTKSRKSAAKKPKAKKAKHKNPAAEGLAKPIFEVSGPPWISDPQIIQARKRVATWLAKIDTSQMLDELLNMHGASALRSMKASDLLQSSQHKIVEAALHNSAARSRAVEIKMQAMRASMTCVNYLDTARNHIRESYADAVRESGSTVGDRKAFLDSGFIGELDSLAMLKQVIEIADTSIDDLDKAGWSLKAIIETLAQSAAMGAGSMKK